MSILKRFPSIGAALFLACLFLAVPAMAQDTDPTGAGLKAYMQTYLDNADPGNQQIRIIESLGGLEGTSRESNRLFCQVEVKDELGTGEALAIWMARMQADPAYPHKEDITPLKAIEYCGMYSEICEHWAWSPTCLQQAGYVF